jgi:hypothetical protein
MLREVEPSNDPNVYELPDADVPPGVGRSITQQPANDGDQRDDSTDDEAFTTDLRQDAGSGETAGTATVPTVTSPYADSDDDNSLSLRSIGLIGAVLVSLGSLAMWLMRKT